MQGIKITADDKISIVDIDLDNISEICDEIGCSIFEGVDTYRIDHYFMHKTKMLVDDEGLCIDKALNKVASWFYGADVHNRPIVGDVLFFYQDGPELIELENSKIFMLQLLSDFDFLVEDE